MSSKFVVSHLDEQMGPYSEDELKAKWSKGELLPIDYIYDETKQDWILLAECFDWAKAPAELPITVTPAMAHVAREAQPKKILPPDPPAEVLEVTDKRRMPDLRRKAVITPSVLPATSASALATALTAAPAPTPAVTSASPSAPTKVQLVNGEGELDLDALSAGAIELVLHDTIPANGLKLAQPWKIQVRAADPVAVEWKLPLNQVVGQDAEIGLQVVDAGGHVCTQHGDSFLVKVSGAADQQIPVMVKEGRASFVLRNTKAETWKLSVHYGGSHTLKLPGEQTLDWLPGPATKLILDGPQEYVAGRPLKVRVKAVDSYGNLAKSYQGTIVLEVKAG